MPRPAARPAAAILAALLALAVSPAGAQSTITAAAGNRTLTIAVPAGYRDLATTETGWRQAMQAFVPDGETLLGVVVAGPETGLPSLDWPTPFALVTVIDASLPGTTNAADFHSQIDFLVNGLRDLSTRTQAEAAALVAEALASGDTPPRYPENSANAITGAQLLGVGHAHDDAGAVTLLHPTPERALIVNEVGFLNLNGQLLKTAVYQRLAGPRTVADVEALGEGIRTATLAANPAPH